MNILIIQENGRHDENKKFRECFSLKRGLEKNGVSSDVWGLGHENFKYSFKEFSKNYDVFFILENYEHGNWIPDLSDEKKLKIFWSIDSHCNLDAHLRLVKKHKVDLILNSIESHQKFFENYRTLYFQNACPSDLVYPIDTIEKNNFMGFCGSPFQYRLNSIELIEKTFNFKIKKDFWVLGENMVKAINSYKIHFNQSDNEDINNRVYETLSTKTLLLTSKNENIDLFFKDMVDVILYENKGEMLEKIKYILENQNMIETISENGYNTVMKNHTFEVRSNQLIDIVKKHI